MERITDGGGDTGSGSSRAGAAGAPPADRWGGPCAGCVAEARSGGVLVPIAGGLSLRGMRDKHRCKSGGECEGEPGDGENAAVFHGVVDVGFLRRDFGF